MQNYNPEEWNPETLEFMGFTLSAYKPTQDGGLFKFSFGIEDKGPLLWSPHANLNQLFEVVDVIQQNYSSCLLDMSYYGGGADVGFYTIDAETDKRTTFATGHGGPFIEALYDAVCGALEKRTAEKNKKEEQS